MALKQGNGLQGWEIAVTKKLIGEFRRRSRSLYREEFDDLLQECLMHWLEVRRQLVPDAIAQKVERIVSREDGQLSLNRGLDEASNPLDIGWRFTKHGGEPRVCVGGTNCWRASRGFGGLIEASIAADVPKRTGNTRSMMIKWMIRCERRAEPGSGLAVAGTLLRRPLPANTPQCLQDEALVDLIRIKMGFPREVPFGAVQVLYRATGSRATHQRVLGRSGTGCRCARWPSRVRRARGCTGLASIA